MLTLLLIGIGLAVSGMVADMVSPGKFRMNKVSVVCFTLAVAVLFTVAIWSFVI